MTKHIAVVGAGWAGLSAAVALTDAGFAVSVYEAGKVLGGRAKRASHAGYELDNGQHLLLGAYEKTRFMMQKVGIAEEAAFLRTPLTICYPKEGVSFVLPRLPAPLHLIFGLLCAKGLSWQDKKLAAFFVRALQKKSWQVDQNLSVEALLSAYAQSPNLRTFLWEPLCLSALNTKLDQASAHSFVGVLAASLGGGKNASDFLFPKDNLSAIFPDAAAGFICAKGGKVYLSHRVVSLEDIRADAVIVATAPQHATRLLCAYPEMSATLRHIAAYRYEPIATLYLWYPTSVALLAPMLGLTPSLNSDFGHWVFDRGQTHGQAGLLAFVMSTGGAWEAEDSLTLSLQLHQRLEATLCQKLPLPHKHFLIVERRATFAETCGRYRPTAQTALPWLFLAGDYTDPLYPATLEGAVGSGMLAAEAVKAYLS